MIMRQMPTEASNVKQFNRQYWDICYVWMAYLTRNSKKELCKFTLLVLRQDVPMVTLCLLALTSNFIVPS